MPGRRKRTPERAPAAPAEKQGGLGGWGNGFINNIVNGAQDLGNSAGNLLDNVVDGGRDIATGIGDTWNDVSEGAGGVRDWWTQITDDEKEDSPSGWVDRTGTRDVSAQYTDLVERAANGEDTLPDDAKDYIYLNVPGLFTERYPGYMDENMERMNELGLDARMVDIDTDANVETNAQAVRDAILAAVEEDGAQVVLTGHSKGGVDIAAALAMYPELAPHVRAVVALQTPFGGTPVASDIAGSEGAMNLAGQAIEGMLGGDSDALTDLSYESRQAFEGAHPYPTNIPTASFATATDSLLSGTALTQRYMDSRYGIESDGLVPMADGVLPGSDYVNAYGLDHAAGAMGSPFGGPATSRPGNITQAMLTLALNKANEQDANGGR